ncbi:MAG: aryl-sulfate sulfotransferase [Gemmatimonadota bacterium]
MTRSLIRALAVSVAASLLGLAACSDSTAPPASGAPTVGSIAAALNPVNALSTLVSFQSTNADSARVLFHGAGGGADSTPFIAIPGGADTIAVLGLLRGTAYSHVVELKGSGGTVRSASVDATTGALPLALQSVHLVLTGTARPGFTLTGVAPTPAQAYVVLFDSLGEIRWYRAIDPGAGIGDVQQQANGNITVYSGNSFGWQPTIGHYLELTPAGDIIRNWVAAPPYYTDNHELLLTFRNGLPDRAHLFGYTIRPADLTSIGGQASVLLAAHQLLRQSPQGLGEFFWDAWDHFTLADWIEEPLSQKQGANVDLDHPNSLAIDLDGNYVVSWRNLAEISKIDAHTGAVLWRLGGAHNQFTILNDPLGGFNGEHCVRVLANGHLLMYDNGLRHQPAESRAVEYAVDTVAKTATMVWEYRHSPAIFTQFLGAVQRLSSGNTWVAWGAAGHLTEVATDGTVAWEGDVQVSGQNVAVYRAFRIGSLYGYSPL